MKQKFLWDRLPAALLLLSLTLFSAGSLAAEAEEEHEEEEEGNAESATINPAMAQQAGITTAAASPGVILDAITVYGRTVIDPRGISHIRARFPGLVISIEPGIGDLVAAGDAVLEIESSESLNSYVIRAPIAGIVTARNANPGETTGDEPLLTLANYDQLWAELAVFPLNAGRIKIGQEVILRTNAQEIRSSVAHILPGTSELPAIVARVPLDNRDALWSPGLLMQADVIIGQADVALAVDNRAIQTFENNPVVFVQEGDIYEPRPVQLGRQDDARTEILSGLELGDQYVVENSYLIKADLEKSSVEDDD
ncbi:MAG: efflux RND transporter periplasmic adaptor subunit [Gammaproteobacteria bacterium]|nr:efflux RND transporter periplasmic adaptor subunit [Gammaproteobacteria bacterium]